MWPFDKTFLFNICFSINFNLHCMAEGWILKGGSCAIAIVQSEIVVLLTYYINKLCIHILYIYIKYTFTNTHIHTHMYIHTYIHIHIYISNFFCRNSHFRKMYFAISWISQGTTVCSCFTISRQSHKINLKLFQKQYNSLIEKVFLIFSIYKKSKDT